MIFNLQLKIESAKPLSDAMKEKWTEISKAISFETAAATIIYLSGILEYYGNSKSNFKLISLTGQICTGLGTMNGKFQQIT